MVDTHFGLTRHAPDARAAGRACAAEIADLTAVPLAAWSDLFVRAVEPNAFYSPEWALAACRHADGHQGAKVLLAWDSPAKKKLIGLLPVVSAWRALKLPLPMLVAWRGYAPLVTPLLDRNAAVQAASGLLEAAKAAGAQALLLPFVTQAGAAAEAFRTALAAQRLTPRMLRSEARALLDANADTGALLHAALGPKKRKELRRQRNRLADGGEVRFTVSGSPQQTEAALDEFLKLEAAGWKGRRGTALAAQAGNLRFIREAARKLSPHGKFEVAMLTRGADMVAAGLVLRHGSRAYFFKIAHDERLAKCSPGMQLVLELTRHFCADETVASADSLADADHPMINHIWKGRLAFGETLMPLRAGISAPLFACVISVRRALREGARRIVRRYRAVLVRRA